jgi:hypothetical protein
MKRAFCYFLAFTEDMASVVPCNAALPASLILTVSVAGLVVASAESDFTAGGFLANCVAEVLAAALAEFTAAIGLDDIFSSLSTLFRE